MFYVLIILLLAVLTVLQIIAKKCLDLIIRPVRHSEEEIIKGETNDGFADSIERYEKEWKREDFTLDCQGAVISGEIIENPKAKGNRVVIVCHGHTVNRYTSLKYADIFYNEGCHVVIYDERYFGRSTGDFCTLGQEETKDLLKVYEMVKERFPGCRIVLHGESMGAATVLLSLRYIKPDAVVADCPFCDSERLFREYIRRNMSIPEILVIPLLEFMAKVKYHYDIRKTSPIAAVKESDVPICLMHGTVDTLIVCDHSEELYKVCRNPLSQLNLFEGARHASSITVDRKRYIKLVHDFLKACDF